MAYGIECRVPFLYDDIKEFSSNTSLDSHFENGPKNLSYAITACYQAT